MANLNDNFESRVRKAFGFLESERHFQISAVEKDNYGSLVMYKGGFVAIRVSLDLYDGRIFVTIYRLKNGRIPEYPIFYESTAEFLVLSFDDLLTVKGEKALGQNPHQINDPNYQELILNEYANLVKKYGMEIINGNFEVLESIKSLVSKRATQSRNGNQ